MFTGIVREVGRVRAIRDEGDRRVEIVCARPAEEIEIGASISCNGVCLTAVEKGVAGTKTWFAVQASAETCAKTTLGSWSEGSAINLEPALRLGDELGGHIVSGHVDGLAEIVAIRPEGASHRVSIKVPNALARYLAPKGSVALDGISLTVNEVEDGAEGTVFGINVIPHTWAVTSFAEASVGTRLNMEIDLLARYVDRLNTAPA
ncbi:MAG: riboflavin synthase [Pseudomonadota bacterium]